MEQTLGQAHRAGQLARVTCQYCHITRHFEPADLAKLLGDVPFTVLLSRMRCERKRCSGDTFRERVWGAMFEAIEGFDI